jgi:predicted DNA-binding transcriptional regulator AlpA
MHRIERTLKRNILRRAAVKQRTGLSDATLWRHERSGKFPKRILLTDSGSVGWFEDEVDAWVHNRVRGGGRRPSGVPPATDSEMRPPENQKARPAEGGVTCMPCKH